MNFKDPCGVCFREVEDGQQGIQCEETCKRWFHMDCAKLTKSEYDRLGKSKNPWKCCRADCEENINNHVGSIISQMAGLASLINGLSAKIDKLTDLPKKIDDIDVKLTNFEERISRSENRLLALEKLKLEAPQGKVEDVISEINDRSRRAKNVIVYNLQESSSSDSSTRISHDQDLVRELIDIICPGVIDYNFNVNRLGKKDGKKVRPLRVSLKTQEDAAVILKNFSHDTVKAAGEALERVKVFRDRTPTETLYMNSLKEELKSRSEKGETDLTIKFRNGIPAIMKKKTFKRQRSLAHLSTLSKGMC